MASILFLPSFAESQLTRITLDLLNTYSSFSRTHLKASDRQRIYDQLYTLRMTGFAVDPRLVTFSLRSGLHSESTRSLFLSSSSTIHRQSFDVYDVNVDLFPGNSFPVSLFSSRNSNSTTAEWDDGPTTGSQKSAFVSATSGIRLSLPGNGYWPYVQIGLDRTSTSGNSPVNPFDQKTENLHLSMKNSNDDDASSYSLTYAAVNSKFELNEYSRALDLRSSGSKPPSQQRMLSASANTRLWESTDITSELRLDNRDNIASRTSRADIRFQTGPTLRHSTSFSQGRVSAYGTQSTTLNFNHYVTIVEDGEQAGQIKMEYLGNHTDFSRGSTLYRRAALGGTWNASFRFRESERLTTSASALLGSEGYGGASNVIVHALSGYALYNSAIVESVTMTLSDDISHSRQLAIGRIFSNLARISFQGNPGLSSIVILDFARSDIQFLDQIRYPRWESFSGQVRSTTSLKSTTQLSLDYKREFRRNIYRDILSTASFTLTDRGLVNNMTTIISGYYSTASYARLRMGRLACGITFQLFAYSLGARYILDDYSGFRSQGFFLEVRRPFAFDFE